jgi:hypothetical protein
MSTPSFFHWYDKPLPEAVTEKRTCKPLQLVVDCGCELIAVTGAIENEPLLTELRLAFEASDTLIL